MPQAKRYVAFFVYLTIPLSGVSTDIYLPSLPAMASHFQTSNLWMQLTVTLYALGLGLGQCIAGPVSDSIGRKKPLLISLIVQLTTVLLILITQKPTLLLALRFLQGIAVAFMSVPARAMLSDCFEGPLLKKKLTYMSTAFSLGPIVAPFIGGYLQHSFNWHANFIFIAAYIILIAGFLLLTQSESMPHKKKFALEHIKTSYTTVLSHPFFMPSIVLLGINMGYVALFNVVAPFMIQDILGQSAIFYGNMALLAGLAWFLGNLTQRMLTNHHWKKQSYVLMPLMLVASALMLFMAQLQHSVFHFMLPTFLMIYLAACLFPLFMSKTLMSFKTHAASANGLLFALLWGSFSLFSFIGGFLKVHTMMPLACVYTGMTLLAYLWFLGVVRKCGDAPRTEEASL